MSKPAIPGGFIILSRKIIESEIWNKPPLYLKVWIYLLTLAQHKEYKELKRGELRTSIPDIIEACKWQVGARVERPTKDQIFRILDWLRKPDEHPSERDTNTTMITTTKATHGIVIKVDNYAFYQDISNYEHNAEHNDETALNTSRTRRERDNINKNDKNDKNDKKEINNYSVEFETFWASYPRKVGKKDCFKTWQRLLKNGESPDLLIKCAENYAAQCANLKTEDRFIKHPKTFLNEERYKDHEKEDQANGHNNVEPFRPRQTPFIPNNANHAAKTAKQNQKVADIGNARANTGSDLDIFVRR